MTQLRNQPTPGVACPEKLPSYGGQALIEGVLMRGSRAVAAAMRAPDGKIVIHTEDLTGIYKAGWSKLPFIRGVTGLWDALGLGMRFLMMSAELQGDEEPPKDGKRPHPPAGGIKTFLLTTTLSIFLGEGMFFTMALSLLLAVALFFAMPAVVGHYAAEWLGLNNWWSSVIEGVVRFVAVIGYIWGVGRMPEIQRVYQYHGAEHKTINAFEDGAELTPENVMRYPLEHPRCGTAFLLTLVVFSVILFSLLGPLPGVWRVASRLILLPVLAGVAYEYLRFTANHIDNPFIRWLVVPNLALQKLTTREPDRGMVEVAITAFTTMKEQEEAAA